MAKQKARTFRCNDLPIKCFPFFEEMKREKEFCDITIHVGNSSIFAHRVILAAGIPYFRSIFSSRNEKKDVNLPNIEPDVLTCLIDYAYTCEVNINADNVKNLLTASCYLNIEEVKQACCDFLFDGLDPESACSIRETAVSLDCPRLLEDTDCYLLENFDIIWKTKDFLSYPLAYLTELIEQDNLNVDSEKQVLEAVLRWVKGSPDDRKDALPELLYKIRMPLLDPLYLRNIVRTEEIIQTSVLCRNIIEDGKDYNLFPEVRDKQCRFKTQQRKSKTEKLGIQEQVYNPSIYKLEAKETYSIESFDLLKKKWTRKEKQRIILNGPAVYFQNKMYFFHFSTTLEYDSRRNVYRKMSSMSTLREYTGTTAFKKKIYVCGGTTYGSQVSSVVECFDPAKDEWETVTFMPTSRHSLNAVTLGEYIFTLGGRSRRTVLDVVERYDPKRNSWTSMSPMLIGRCNAGAVILNRRIYVSGGDTSNAGIVATAEVYDPVDDQWVFISSMSSARYLFTLLSCQGKLYAIGGMDNYWATVQQFDIYDPGTDIWTFGSSTGNCCNPIIAAVMPSFDG